MTVLLSALVIADNEPSNHRIAQAVKRELKSVADMRGFLCDDIQTAAREIQSNFAAFDFAVVDGPTIQGRFSDVTKIVGRVPIIALHCKQTAPMTPEKAINLGLDPTLLIARPFPQHSLANTVNILRQKIIMPPPEGLVGLFAHSASVNVFMDGRALEKLLEIERDILRLIIKNQNSLSGNIAEMFRVSVLGDHYTSETAQSIFSRFSKLLERKLPEITDGRYAFERETDAHGQVVYCHVAARAGAPIPRSC